MGATSLTSLSALEMREGLLKGTFSARDLVQAHLDRIRATNEALHSFLRVTDDSALTLADQADQTLRAQGKDAPPLTGIPIAVKDNLVTKGVETTAGSKILKGFIPPYDCTAVLKLKQKGAIVVGKTNLDEFAMGSSTENSAYGPSKNPYDTKRVPGGSSGGSAVSVASGQSALALGTDTGGSIRQPASLCGLVGIRPTYGRVSRYGAIAYASSLDQIGLFGRDVEDLAFALSYMAGHDEFDSTSMRTAVPDYLAQIRETGGKGLSGIRVGVPKEYFIPGMDRQVEASVREGIKTLEKLGAELVEISLPHTQFAISAYYIIAPAEASSNLARYDGVRYGFRSKNFKSLSEMYARTRDEGFGAEVKRRIMIGTYVLSAGYYDAYYKKAQQVRTLIINDFKAAFNNNCHLIATPTAPTTAFLIGEKTADPLAMYLADAFTIPPNLAGLPGVSVPCGFDSQGLPIGMQLLAAPFGESDLLKVANEFFKEKKIDTRVNTVKSFNA